MKNKYRRRRHTIEAKGNSTVFVDGHGREYYLVERQKPDQQKRLFSTDKDKRTVKGYMTATNCRLPTDHYSKKYTCSEIFYNTIFV